MQRFISLEEKKLPRGPRRGDLFELEITDLDEKGRGLTYRSFEVGPQGEKKHYTFVIPGAVPRDRWIARVLRKKRHLIEMKGMENSVPSALRISVRCAHAKSYDGKQSGCGGCKLQSLPYPWTLAFKAHKVKQLLIQKEVPFQKFLDPIPSKQVWHYRNKMEFSFGDTRDRKSTLGLHPAGYKYEVIALNQCEIASEWTSNALKPIREWFENKNIPVFKRGEGFLKSLIFREGFRSGQRMLVLVTTNLSKSFFEGQCIAAEKIIEAFKNFLINQFKDQIHHLVWAVHHTQRGQKSFYDMKIIFGQEYFLEKMYIFEKKLLFKIHAMAFFQINLFQAEKLFEEVLKTMGLAQKNEKIGTVLDLYCGTGTIGISMAPFAEHVIGIDIHKGAIESARQNAQYNHLDNIEFYIGDSGKILKQLNIENKLSKIDWIIVDPPRAGLGSKTIREIVDIGAREMIYVSCHPKSLSKDLKMLSECGYEIQKVQPIDLFPQTMHIENIVHLLNPKRGVIKK